MHDFHLTKRFDDTFETHMMILSCICHIQLEINIITITSLADCLYRPWKGMFGVEQNKVEQFILF